MLAVPAAQPTYLGPDVPSGITPHLESDGDEFAVLAQIRFPRRLSILTRNGVGWRERDTLRVPIDTEPFDLSRPDDPDERDRFRAADELRYTLVLTLEPGVDPLPDRVMA